MIINTAKQPPPSAEAKEEYPNQVHSQLCLHSPYPDLEMACRDKTRRPLSSPWFTCSTDRFRSSLTLFVGPKSIR